MLKGKKKDKISNNAFKPPAELDEVSVNRLDFTTPSELKRISKINETSERKYFGFACLNASEIVAENFELTYTPKNNNPYHADIIIDQKVIRGVPLDAELNERINSLAKNARFYPDSNPSADEWLGKPIH